MYHSRGFTLIELLVVIAIIALLTAIGLVSYNTVQMKARDSRRVSDVQQIQTALGLYMINEGAYPVATATTTLDGTDSVSNALIEAESFPTIPLDPIHPTYSYAYRSNEAGTDYTISFCLETDSVENYDEGCGNTVSP